MIIYYNTSAQESITGNRQHLGKIANRFGVFDGSGEEEIEFNFRRRRRPESTGRGPT